MWLSSFLEFNCRNIWYNSFLLLTTIKLIFFQALNHYIWNSIFDNISSFLTKYLKNKDFSAFNEYYCFLNLWLSKALNRSQKSIVEFRHFLCLYMIYIEKKVVCRKCMYVCLCACVRVCVCVCKLSIFCRAITWKRLHRSLWNFAWLFVYVFSRTLLILAMICRKLAFLGYIVVFA